MRFAWKKNDEIFEEKICTKQSVVQRSACTRTGTRANEPVQSVINRAVGRIARVKRIFLHEIERGWINGEKNRLRFVGTEKSWFVHISSQLSINVHTTTEYK